MSLRCAQISYLVLDSAPGEEVLRFLRRVTRSYVAGFDPECIVLCRAVLENAVRTRIREIEEPPTASNTPAHSMLSRLRLLRERGTLSAEGLEAARTVWHRGNKAVHEDPMVTQDAIGTIRLVVHVLDELYADADAA